MALAIISAMCAIGQAIDLGMGDSKWWQLISMICIIGLWFMFWKRYRDAVRKGNLFGRVRLLQ